MAVVLEGGCRVTQMREVTPVPIGTVKLWNHVNKTTGAQAISLSVLQFAPGMSPGFRNSNADEILYFLENLNEAGSDPVCVLYIDGQPFTLESRTGIYVKPGQTINVRNDGTEDVLFVSSRCPDQSQTRETVSSLTEPLSVTDIGAQLVRLSEQRAMPTADRWYRILVDEKVGSSQVTQFVGSIPFGRAPDHFHEYEEVLFILRGSGRMWAGSSSTEIGPGSCIYLPRRQMHCVENTADAELRLLGVFYPAGSPAVRYDKEQRTKDKGQPTTDRFQQNP